MLTVAFGAAGCTDDAPTAIAPEVSERWVSANSVRSATLDVGDTVTASTVLKGGVRWSVADAKILRQISKQTFVGIAPGQTYAIAEGYVKRNLGQKDSVLITVKGEAAPTPPDTSEVAPPEGSTTPEPEPEPEPEPTPEPVTPAASGIWVSGQQLSALPMSGAAWSALLADANRTGSANVSDQNSNHDVHTMAAALVCARTGQASYCDKARSAVVSAIGTEQGGRWLAVGRNMLGYVIAADLVGLRADGNPSSAGSRVDAWIRSFLTMKLSHNNDAGRMVQLIPFGSGSNASAQEGAVYAAVAAYAKDGPALTRAWDAFRTYACDPTAPDREDINLSRGIEYGWAHDTANPCAVNPKGTSKVVPSGRPGAGTTRRLDGAIINDMRRGGEFQWEPGYTAYPWVGMEGFVPTALLLHRAGFPAFEVADRAVLRATEYLWYLRTETGNTAWFDGSRAAEIVHIVNVVYGKSFPVESGVGGGRTLGYTDWTFPKGVN